MSESPLKQLHSHAPSIATRLLEKFSQHHGFEVKELIVLPKPDYPIDNVQMSLAFKVALKAGDEKEELEVQRNGAKNVLQEKGRNRLKKLWNVLGESPFGASDIRASIRPRNFVIHMEEEEQSATVQQDAMISLPGCMDKEGKLRKPKLVISWVVAMAMRDNILDLHLVTQAISSQPCWYEPKNTAS